MHDNPAHIADTDYRPRRRWLRPVLLFVGAFVLGGLVLPNLHVSWREADSSAQRATGLEIKQEKPQPLSEAESYAKAAQIARNPARLP